MLTPTPSLPLPAVSLCMCRHGSAAVMPCGSDCIHWRCWWLPLPSHFFFLLPFQLLCCFITRCVGSVCGEGEGDACFTQPHHQPLANNCRLVAACLCWWLRGEGGCVTFTGCPCGCSSPPLPHAVLFVGASMAHAAHTQPRHHHTCHGIVASLPILSSPLSVTARIPAAAAGGRRPDKHPHVMMMMTRAGVCHCVHHTSC